MADLSRLESIVFEKYNSLYNPALRMAAVSHTIRVMDAMMLVNPSENARAAALLHDLARYTENVGKGHGPRSAVLACALLKECGFDEESIQAVTSAIACHSKKRQTDCALAEDLKDADVLARWLEDPACTHFRMESALARIKAKPSR